MLAVGIRSKSRKNARCCADDLERFRDVNDPREKMNVRSDEFLLTLSDRGFVISSLFSLFFGIFTEVTV